VIDLIELEATVEVEEFCLNRKLDLKEKTQVILNSIKAPFKIVIDTKGFNPLENKLKVCYLEYYAVNPMPSDRYDILPIDDHTIALFVYFCLGESAMLCSEDMK